MKTSSKVIIGIIVVAILWVFYVAYEKTQYEIKLKAPQPVPTKVIVPKFPSNQTPISNPKG